MQRPRTPGRRGRTAGNDSARARGSQSPPASPCGRTCQGARAAGVRGRGGTAGEGRGARAGASEGEGGGWAAAPAYQRAQRRRAQGIARKRSALLQGLGKGGVVHAQRLK